MLNLPEIQPMTTGKKGRWVFVPAESWETKPESYYSMALGSIYLRLVFRLPDSDVKFCMKHGISPRPTLSNKQLPIFVEGARAGVNSIHPLILGREIKGCFHSDS